MAQLGFGDFPRPMHWSLLFWVESVAQVRWIIVQILLKFYIKIAYFGQKKNIWRCYFVFQAKCCGYGTNGQMTIGYDCVIIPISTLKNTLGALIPGSSDEFCGRALASQSNNGPATICSKKFIFCYLLTIWGYFFLWIYILFLPDF